MTPILSCHMMPILAFSFALFSDLNFFYLWRFSLLNRCSIDCYNVKDQRDREGKNHLENEEGMQENMADREVGVLLNLHA